MKVLECMDKFKPDLTVLQEIKKVVIGGRLVRSTVGGVTSEWCVLFAIGTSGGIFMASHPNVIKKIDTWLGVFSISLRLVDVSLGVEWLFTSI